jgi:hypothetical protein
MWRYLGIFLLDLSPEVLEPSFPESPESDLGEARFVVLAVKPCFVPSPEIIFQGKLKKTSTRVSL